MVLHPNAIFAVKDTLGNFNQLKGKKMVVHFRENVVDYVSVDGNGESIYFVMDAKRQLQGMNYLRCSQIYVCLEEGQISLVKFKTKPEGIFYPPPEIKEQNKLLEHFHWKGEERPTRKEVVEHGYGEQEEYKEFKIGGKP